MRTTISLPLAGAIFLLPLLAPNRARAEDAPSGSLIEAVDGTSRVNVRTPGYPPRAAKAGERLKAGDTVETDKDTLTRVSFENGSQVVLAEGSKLTLQEGDTDADGKKVPAVELVQGDARVLVDAAAKADGKAETKAEAPAAAEGETSDSDKYAAPTKTKPLRFTIRTRSFTMGVRGTNFIVSANDSLASVNTFEGTVEVAADLKTLKQGTGTPVPPGKSLSGEADKPLEPAGAFDPDAFLKKFNEKHPKFDGLWKAALKDSESGAIIKHFEAPAAAPAPAEEEKGLTKDKSQADEIEFKGKAKPKAPAPVKKPGAKAVVVPEGK